jgi:predicted Ser/Thr protein kinase
MAHGCANAAYHAKDLSWSTSYPKAEPVNWDTYQDTDAHRNLIYVPKSKKHTPDQQAINDLVKESGNKGISNSDADTLLEWAEEYNFPSRDDRGKDHWVGGEHIHIGPKHVPISD